MKKTDSITHFGLDVLNQLSLSIQNIPEKDEFTGIDYRKFVHAFVVINQFDQNSLNVCEAVEEGIKRAEIKIGDSDWTSMILFVPKNRLLA